ncbi:MAG: SGNH/GDSL hydrolase family protein [Bryobacterales bacterium]|nr:SGNH/GDSL hydrolase family protein [Bryobacterales bacterium]
MTRRTAIGTGMAAALLQAAGVTDGIKALLDTKKPLTWVFTGDSITHGASHTLGWRSYPEHLAERIRWEMRRVRDMVINTGISGDRLHRMLPEFEARVGRFQPQIVSVNFGMNDCVAGAEGREVFRKSLGECRERVQALGAQMVLHAPNLIHYPADAARKDLAAYVEIVREFAAMHRLVLVDHYAEWSVPARSQPAHRLLMLLNDGAIHPNQYGHILMAHTTMRALGIFDAQSATGRLFVP